MVDSVKRFDVFWVNLDPTLGNEIKKTRPAVVISPDEMNKYLGTVIIAPLTSSVRNYPTRVNHTFQKKNGQIVLDQIRAIDKQRLVSKMGAISSKAAEKLCTLLNEMFGY